MCSPAGDTTSASYRSSTCTWRAKWRGAETWTARSLMRGALDDLVAKDSYWPGAFRRPEFSWKPCSIGEAAPTCRSRGRNGSTCPGTDRSRLGFS